VFAKFKITKIAAVFGIGLLYSSAQWLDSLDKVYEGITTPTYNLTLYHSDVHGESKTYLVPSNEKENKADSIDLLSYVYVLSLGVVFVGDVKRGVSRLIGGYSQLKNELSEFDFIENSTLSGNVISSSFKVLVPNNIIDIGLLKDALDKFSVFYIWPDGTKTLNLVSLRMGSGIENSIK
jgi:hypothetical protein